MSEKTNSNIQCDCSKHEFIDVETEPYVYLSDDEKIDIVARNVMQRYKAAFIELAK